MKRALRAEALKLVTTRTVMGLLLGEIAVVALTVSSTVASSKASSLTGPLHEQVFFLLTSINVGLFSLVVGIRVIADEFRYSTIAHSFLSEPRRWKTLIAKVLVAASAATALAAIALLVLVAIAIPLASGKGGGLTVASTDISAFLGFLFANALWAAIGVGFGALVRQQVAGIVGGLLWVLVVENLGSGFLGAAGRYLPGQAAYALSAALEGAEALDVTTAGMILASYALVAVSIGIVATVRRDVT